MEILVASSMSVDEHVQIINDCRNHVRTATFEFIHAVKKAYDELGQDVFQNELARKIGMSNSTLSRWLSIGSSEIIQRNSDSVPPVFSSLFEITLLEKEYLKVYEGKGLKKLQTLFNRKSIATDSEQKDIKQLVDNVRAEKRAIKGAIRESLIISHQGGTGYEHSDNSPSNLADLITTGALFKTIIIIPPSDQLTKWNDPGLFANDLYEQFPIADLRGMTTGGAINCFISVKTSRIDVAIKVLTANGFSYRDIFVPQQPRTGFDRIKEQNVVVYGQRGSERLPDFKPTLATDTQSIIDLAEQLGKEPNLLLFANVNSEKWVCLPQPI